LANILTGNVVKEYSRRRTPFRSAGKDLQRGHFKPICDWKPAGFDLMYRL